MDIEGFLAQNKHQSLIWWGTIFTEDGKPVPGVKAIANLQNALERGQRMISMGGCPNFDPVTGCPGHEINEVQEAVKLRD
jgi:hypothetical protein